MLAALDSIDDAAHDGEGQVFEASVFFFPGGHHVAHIAFGLLGELLEGGARRSTTAGACGDAGAEATNVEGLE